jgi:putative endonuclease
MEANKPVFYIYVTTNSSKSTLYIGITNSLKNRIFEHWSKRGQPGTFAGKYFCHNLIYYESFKYVNDAIAREKELKKWNRKKKEQLIASKNPEWLFLNTELFDTWPPQKLKLPILFRAQREI